MLPLLRPALLLSSALLVACVGPSTPSFPLTGTALAASRLVEGYHSGLEQRGAVLVHSLADWQAIWAQHSSWRLPADPCPSVDFTQHCVLITTAGRCPSAGWSLELERIERDAQGVLVRAKLQAPRPDSLVPQVITTPYQMLLLPRIEGNARLEISAGS